MSKINYSDGKFFLIGDGQSELLLDVLTPLANKSCIHSHQFTEKDGIIYPLEDEVHGAIKNFFRGTFDSLAEVVIYLRIVNRLLVKPQIHKVLCVGQWSPFYESLAKILSKFNPANKLYCLTEMRPLGKIPSVNFIFAEGGEYLLPENKFDTIIFSEQRTPPPEILLAINFHGKIYFAAPNADLFLKVHTKIFTLTEGLRLFELKISPKFREELRSLTPQGQLEEGKLLIAEVVERLPALFNKKNPNLDEYIAEFSRAEKVLAEIFPELHSDTIKFNFNLLKESLIDLRLGYATAADVNRRYKILSEDLHH